MKIATILFTYNRSWHTQKTLDALKENTVLPQKLFVFQDGLKDLNHKAEWDKVGQIISHIDWCEKEIVISPNNKGLAASISEGVTSVFEEYDAVIVLEDDCVSHPLFMKYATDCLQKYKDEEKVFAINGYSWPVNVQENGTDVFFTGRAGSWGWATWKNRWKYYEQDYTILRSIKNDKELCEQFEIWGQDLECYLKGNIDGICDSWAVFWALQCIKRGGFCPTPYQSLIQNIGFDGSGTHCSNMDIVDRTRKKESMEEIKFPDTVEYPVNYKEIYSDKFRWVSPEIRQKCYNNMLYQWNLLLQNGRSIKDFFRDKKLDSIAIWGKGQLCKLLLNELGTEVRVECIVESCPVTVSYEGIPIVAPDGLSDKVQMVVVIPTYDIKSIRRKVSTSRNVIGLDEILRDLLGESKQP